MIVKNSRDWPSWMSWTYRSPFNEIDRLRREMNQLYQGLAASSNHSARSIVFPAVNLTQDPKHYFIRAELPGMTADDIDITATGKTITIAGERRILEEKEVKYHRRGRESGRFSRALGLPGDIDVAGISASMKDGVLTIVIPKSEKARPRQITVT